jgi:hypothetical protein
MDNQLIATWRGVISTHKEARTLISGLSPTAKIRLLSFNRTPSRNVNGVLTGHNLRGHLHLIGLIDSPLCRKCGEEEETSIHVLCECEAVALFRHAYFGSFFLDPENVKSLNLQ